MPKAPEYHENYRFFDTLFTKKRTPFFFMKVNLLMGPTSSGTTLTLTEMTKKILVLTQAADDAFQVRRLFHGGKTIKKYMVVGPDYSYGYSSWDLYKIKLKEPRPDIENAGELFPKLWPLKNILWHGKPLKDRK